MTRVYKNKTLTPTGQRKVKAGDIFSWGVQGVWYLKTKKGARPVGSAARYANKYSEEQCLEVFKLPTFVLAKTVTISE